MENKETCKWTEEEAKKRKEAIRKENVVMMVCSKNGCEVVERETCKWNTDWTLVKPECQERYIANNEFIYCPYCGKPVEEISDGE